MLPELSRLAYHLWTPIPPWIADCASRSQAQRRCASRGGAEREREGESPEKATHCPRRGRRGARTHDLSRRQWSDAQPTEPPGTPQTPHFLMASRRRPKVQGSQGLSRPKCLDLGLWNVVSGSPGNLLGMQILRPAESEALGMGPSTPFEHLLWMARRFENRRSVGRARTGRGRQVGKDVLWSTSSGPHTRTNNPPNSVSSRGN